MAHFYKKIKNNRTYWYMRKTYRHEGKVKVKWQRYLGTANTIWKKLQEAEAKAKPWKISTEIFGSVFLAHVLEKELSTIELIDSVVPASNGSNSPSVGEYFFYAWTNRMIHPKSKKGLESWYKKTAIQHLRPVNLSHLSSERYWQKWDKVSDSHVRKIAKSFFRKVSEIQDVSPDVLLFDTTNYFTYMNSKTFSELSLRGKNKGGKHSLRQIGVGVVQDRRTSLPVYYTEYPGNMHDSKLFYKIKGEIFQLFSEYSQKRATIVFDKGMNSESNIADIDKTGNINFITNYSPYFVDKEMLRDVSKFKILDIPGNRKLIASGEPEECIRAFRTTNKFWSAERTMVITFNPATQRKKIYKMMDKLEKISHELSVYQSKYNKGDPHWRDKDKILDRYYRLCERLHISHKFYDVEFTDSGEMVYGKNHKEIESSTETMGKNIIVTDNADWSTEEIVQASLDRYKIENQFRVSKDPFRVRVNPMYHWTDSKIRCHILTCMIALTALRLLEIKTGDKYTSKVIMEEMNNLNCVLAWYKGAKQPEVLIEEPNEIQKEILDMLGYEIKNSWVLQK